MDPVEELTDIHGALSKLVKPASPASLAFIKAQRESLGNRATLGPIPVIRWMMGVSIVSIVVFVLISVLGDFPPAGVPKDALSVSHQLSQALFLLSAAVVGACFANLYRAYQYVTRGTYDRSLDNTYWIRIILGVMAGYLLAEIIDISDQSGFDKPLLALLGGFSASAVYKLLMRMVQAVESLVDGDIKNRLKSREAELQAASEQREIVQRVNLVKRMQALADTMPETADGRRAREGLRRMMDKVLDGE